MRKFLYFLLALSLVLFSGMMISCSSGDDGDDDDPPAFPDGALAGKFSISDTHKVHFSKGNLQATYKGSKRFWESRYTWGFADNQYDYIGNASGNIFIDKPSIGEVVDLFCWPSPGKNFGITTSTQNYSTDFMEWGNVFDMKGTWRTLSYDEWKYLLEGRANASSLYKCGVEVCGKPNCLIIAPDDFTETIADSYDMSMWFIAENSGLVCLPAAGHRYKSKVIYDGSKGYYRSSSVDNPIGLGYLPVTCEFSQESAFITINQFWEGYSVRLVTNAK